MASGCSTLFVKHSEYLSGRQQWLFVKHGIGNFIVALKTRFVAYSFKPRVLTLAGVRHQAEKEEKTWKQAYACMLVNHNTFQILKVGEALSQFRFNF